MNPYTGYNAHGTTLLTLCKTTGLHCKWKTQRRSGMYLLMLLKSVVVFVYSFHMLVVIIVTYM